LSFITEHNEKYKDFRPLQQSIPFNEEMYDVKSNVTIGKGTILYPNVTIYDNVSIGENCVIDSGAVIGAEGFSIHWEDGEWVDMKNVGGVIIGDNVKIGANTCIDRGSLLGHHTIIESGVKIDNLCHIAHNVKIRHRSIICPQVCVGGSTDIGEGVWVGIGAKLQEHIVIGDNSFICMGAIVTEDVLNNTKVMPGWKVYSNRKLV
jgi:UDP-3-O-[3-hydroxymyristoyl] glucosamine N-acyltransferase